MTPISSDDIAATILDTAQVWVRYLNFPFPDGPQYKVTWADGSVNLSPLDPEEVHPDDARGADFEIKIEVKRL